MTEKQVKRRITLAAAALAALLLLLLPDIPLSKPLRELIAPLTLIPVDELILERELPKPKPRPLTFGAVSALSSPAPYFAPTEVSAPPSQIVIAEPSPEPPEVGLISELFRRPAEDPAPVRLEPVASPLPDVLTQRDHESPPQPPAALPGPAPQRGQVYRGAGAPDLDVSTQPAYTGPNLNLPTTELPSSGLTRGDAIAASPAPGISSGERYQSAVGASPGTGPSTGLEPLGDVIGEGELSGLLAWLRKQKADFPPVVQSYMETVPADLRGVTRYAGWDVYVQFSEPEHQLKIFLSRGTTGILLADSDFKQRSQLFGLGRATRDDAGVITAIEAIREKPSRERTDEFYRVFGDWMSAQGIKLGARTAK